MLAQSYPRYVHSHDGDCLVSQISFKEAFQGGPLAKQAVIAAMAHCDKVDIDMLVHFST